MEFLLFLGALALVVYSLSKRRRNPVQKYLPVYSGLSSDRMQNPCRPPDDAFTLMYSLWPDRQATLDDATAFLRDARQKLAERHAERLLDPSRSTVDADAEFETAWKKVLSASAARFGDKTTGVAMIRLGF